MILIDAECRVCGGGSFRLWGRRDGLVLYQCRECDLVFFHPYPTKTDLDRYYNTNYHLQRNYDGTGTAGTLRVGMYELDIADLETTISSRGRFLDVGCAEGVFLAMLDEEWEKLGLDVSSDAVKRAQEKSGVEATVGDIQDVEKESVDVIHLRGVFEHLLEPGEFVNAAAARLRPGGHLILSNTPNIGGIVPRLFRGRFRLIIPNEHVNYYSCRTMMELASRNGMEVLKVTYPYYGTPYASPIRDFLCVPWNLMTGKSSPPFFKSIFTVYMGKIRNEKTS